MDGNAVLMHRKDVPAAGGSLPLDLLHSGGQSRAMFLIHEISGKDGHKGLGHHPATTLPLSHTYVIITRTRDLFECRRRSIFELSGFLEFHGVLFFYGATARMCKRQIGTKGSHFSSFPENRGKRWKPGIMAKIEKNSKAG